MGIVRLRPLICHVYEAAHQLSYPAKTDPWLAARNTARDRPLARTPYHGTIGVRASNPRPDSAFDQKPCSATEIISSKPSDDRMIRPRRHYWCAPAPLPIESDHGARKVFAGLPPCRKTPAAPISTCRRAPAARSELLLRFQKS